MHLTNDEDAINKDYRCDVPVLGDAKLVLQQLLAALHTQAGAPRAVDTALHEEIRATKAAWLGQWMPKLTATTTPINPYRVVWDLMHTVDLDHVIVTHESGSAREYMVPFWEARQPRSFLGWGKSTQLGYSLGLAMGAKLAAPDKQVINVMGDMAFSTVGLDIETAVRCHIPILTIVLNNAFMSIYDNSRFPVALEKYDVKRLSGQFAEVAQAMGAYSEKHHRSAGDRPRPEARPRRGGRWQGDGAGIYHRGRRGVLEVCVSVAWTAMWRQPRHGQGKDSPLSLPSIARKLRKRTWIRWIFARPYVRSPCRRCCSWGRKRPPRPWSSNSVWRSRFPPVAWRSTRKWVTALTCSSPTGASNKYGHFWGPIADRPSAQNILRSLSSERKLTRNGYTRCSSLSSEENPMPTPCPGSDAALAGDHSRWLYDQYRNLTPMHHPGAHTPEQ